MRRFREIKIWKFHIRHWYSICSRHYHGKDDCPACNTGSSRWFFSVWISRFFYGPSPSKGGPLGKTGREIWLWYVNRPNSKAKRELKKWFPRLK